MKTNKTTKWIHTDFVGFYWDYYILVCLSAEIRKQNLSHLALKYKGIRRFLNKLEFDHKRTIKQQLHFLAGLIQYFQCRITLKLSLFDDSFFFSFFLFFCLDVPWDFLLTSSLLLLVFFLQHTFLILWALTSSFTSTFLAWCPSLFGSFTFHWTQHSYNDVCLHIITFLPCNNNLLAISILDVLITAAI